MPFLAELVESVNTGADAIQKAPIVEENTGIRCLRIGDVSQRKPFREWGFTNAKPDVIERFQLKKGDIIIARTGNTIGVNKYIKENLRSVYNNGLIRIRVNACSTVPEFIYYNLQTETFREFIRSIAFGTSTQPNMQIKDMLRYEIANIAKKEQQAIVYILRTLDDKIELNRKMNETLEAMAQALFKSWFVDFNGVALEDMCESAMGWTPKGWNIQRISNFMVLSYGKALPEKNRHNGSVPVYGSGGITGFHDQALITEKTIIVGRKGTVGSLYWESRPCFPIDTVFYVQPILPLSFCYFLLKNLPLRFMNTDAAVPGLNRENVYRLEFPLPPADLISLFSKNADVLRNKIDANSREIESLSRLRDILLPKLISGQLRIKDVEKILGNIA